VSSGQFLLPAYSTEIWVSFWPLATDHWPLLLKFIVR